MENRRITVAVDGPVASGKSTVARMLAQRLSYLHIDSGAMYRAVALRSLTVGLDLSDSNELRGIACKVRMAFCERDGEERILLDGEDVTEAVRGPEVADAASRVASVPGVREALIRAQREMGRDGGVVMDGRDIGTVVFPDAELKIYLTARPEVRARRRYQELMTRGMRTSLRETERLITERDARDNQTQIWQSGALKAHDAVVIDTTNLSIQDQLTTILSLAMDRGACVTAMTRA